MRNFIKVTEVQFSDNKTPKYYNDYIRPAEIVLMEQLTIEGKQVTKLHFAIGSNKCSIYVKETPEEVDDIMNDFFFHKKDKPTVRIAEETVKKTTRGRTVNGSR